VIIETLDALGLGPLEMPATLVRSHGPFTWGRDPADALANAVALEAVAAMAERTLTLDAAAATIDEALLRRHFERKHGPAAYYGQVRPARLTAMPATGAPKGREGAGTAAELIRSGRAILGIELGSTRIKASLIAPDATPLASGWHVWENQLRDGIWTYEMADVWAGLTGAYASLVEDVRGRHAVELRTVAAMGFSGMMHGYVALDAAGELLVPFRTWRNNITGQACAELTPLLDFAVPQRWTIAHLYQSMLEDQPHVPRIAHLTTLAGYVHWKLTGDQAVGIGEASGIFPVDHESSDWDAARLATFDGLVAPRKLGWTLRDILPAVLPAGRPAVRIRAAQNAALGRWIDRSHEVRIVYDAEDVLVLVDNDGCD